MPLPNVSAAPHAAVIDFMGYRARKIHSRVKVEYTGGMLFSQKYSVFFFDFVETLDFMAKQRCSFEDMQLVLCEPCAGPSGRPQLNGQYATDRAIAWPLGSLE
jgi:hypothetical protein